MPPSGSVPTTTRSSASYKVAKYYYYPGWWEPGATPHYIFNLAKWNELPKTYQGGAARRLARSRACG